MYHKTWNPITRVIQDFESNHPSSRVVVKPDWLFSWTIIIYLSINVNKVILVMYEMLLTYFYWFLGLVVTTLDFESNNLNANLGQTFFTFFFNRNYIVWVSHPQISLHYSTLAKLCKHSSFFSWIITKNYMFEYPILMYHFNMLPQISMAPFLFVSWIIAICLSIPSPCITSLCHSPSL